MLSPPLGTILDIFEFEDISMAKDPRANILKGLLRHIYIECPNCPMSKFEFQTFLFLPPPPHLGHCPQIFTVLNYDASP